MEEKYHKSLCMVGGGLGREGGWRGEEGKGKGKGEKGRGKGGGRGGGILKKKVVHKVWTSLSNIITEHDR